MPLVRTSDKGTMQEIRDQRRGTDPILCLDVELAANNSIKGRGSVEAGHYTDAVISRKTQNVIGNTCFGDSRWTK